MTSKRLLASLSCVDYLIPHLYRSMCTACLHLKHGMAKSGIHFPAGTFVTAQFSLKASECSEPACLPASPFPLLPSFPPLSDIGSRRRLPRPRPSSCFPLSLLPLRIRTYLPAYLPTHHPSRFLSPFPTTASDFL